MPLDYSHPRTIRFLKENYDKENEKRIAWFVKNKEQIIKTTTLNEKHKGYHTEHVARAYIEPIIPILKLHHEVSKGNRRTKVILDKPLQKESLITDVDIISESVMKPVDPNIIKLIYEELPTGGRRKYLDARNEKAPEDRYNFCETTNNVCGWKLRDSEGVYQTSACRRYASLKRDTTSRTGPQPDPKHYSHLEIYKKCNI